MIEAAPIVSVVVPIYNGERYLRDSLDSLLAQTFQDFEIICVNDGSTDSSESIINEYAERDSRVKIVNQTNGGVASARNAGIENAEGRYLLFCDDDDLFASNMLEAMVGTMERNNADICIPNGYKLDMADNERVVDFNFINTKFLPEKECFSPRDAGKYLLNFPTFFIYKMYRLPFVREHGIFFDARRAEEDALFFTQALLLSERITVVKDRLFYYRVNAGDSVSDLIYQQDIMAGYESMLTVKALMMEYGMYEDAAFHQSYVNRALTKTMDYRSRTKNFESLSTLFGKLVLEDGLNDMDLLGHEPDYYYNQQHYQELQALASSEDAEEYLFYLFDTSRNNLVLEKRRNRDLKAKVAEQKKQLAKKTQEYKDFRARAIPINPQLKKVLRKLRHPFSKR